MAYALLIKNMDFSANALDTVTVEGQVPCTGISLNMNSVAMSALGSTGQLAATVTPGNCTDTVMWASSNTSIVTVVDGLITQTGVGTATVTATCGMYSAECTVTATNVLTYTSTKLVRVNAGGTNYDYYYIVDPDSVSYCALYNLDKPTPYWCNNEVTSLGYDHVYPIRLGGNAQTISITGVPEDVRVTCFQMDCDQVCDYGKANPGMPHAHYAKRIGGDASSYDSSVPLGEDRTISVMEGANSAIFAMQHKGGTITDAEIAAVTITVT